MSRGLLSQLSKFFTPIVELISDDDLDDTLDLPLTPGASPGNGTADTLSAPAPGSLASTTLSDSFHSVVSAAGEHLSNPSSLSSPTPTRVLAMSDYVIPDDASAEVLKQMLDETEQKLAAKRAAVDAEADDQARRRLETEENRLFGFLQRLEYRRSIATVDSFKGIVEANRNDIAELKRSNVRRDEVIEEVRDDVANAVERLDFVEKFCFQLRNTVDHIDNNQRRQNMLVYGLKVQQDINPLVDSLFQGNRKLLHELDEAYFLGTDPAKKKPLKLHFKSCSGATAFFHYAKSNAFGHKHLAVGRDQSALRRVGVSRLMASVQGLVAEFPGIHVTPSHSFARFNGVKYEAIEFAAGSIFIDGVDFDIEEACRGNNEFEEDSLSIEQGDATTSAFRKKKRPATRRSNEADRVRPNEDPSQGPSQVLPSNGQALQGRQLVAMMVPPVRGQNEGGVEVSAGGSGAARRRLDVPGALANPYEVR
jgi:hypothetical protein